jgi:hypothetical protein
LNIIWGSRSTDKALFQIICTPKKNFNLQLQNYLQDTLANSTTTRILVHQLSRWINNNTMHTLQEIAPDASHAQQIAFEAQSRFG